MMDDTAAKAGAAAPRRAKKAKKQSRADRWAEAIAQAKEVIDEARSAIEAVKEVQEEYQEWLDNLPESLATAPVGEKLQAVCDIDLDGAGGSLDEAEAVLDEAEGADLPLGFGRD